MSCYVVTGGAGFLGCHLAAHLGEAGHDVRVLDNLTGDGARERVKILCAVPNIEFFDGDVRDSSLCRTLCADAGFVFHLAETRAEDAAECASVNIGGTVCLLDAARESSSVKRFVYASTGAVYGDAPGGARHEASLPDPISAFASSKLSGEFFCRAAFRRHGFPAVILRFFSIYGPGDCLGVVSRFCDAARQNSPLSIDGDGEQSRDFLFVSDAVEACLCAARATRGTGGKVFNVGSGTKTSVNQLAEKVEKWVGETRARERRDAKSGKIRHARADIAAAAGLLQFAPTVSLEKGLARTLQYNAREISAYRQEK